MAANQTSFRKGEDPRRHRFTTEERRRGYITTCQRHGEYDPAAEWILPPEWLRRRLRTARRAKRRQAAA